MVKSSLRSGSKDLPSICPTRGSGRSARSCPDRRNASPRSSPYDHTWSHHESEFRADARAVRAASAGGRRRHVHPPEPRRRALDGHRRVVWRRALFGAASPARHRGLSLLRGRSAPHAAAIPEWTHRGTGARDRLRRRTSSAGRRAKGRLAGKPQRRTVDAQRLHDGARLPLGGLRDGRRRGAGETVSGGCAAHPGSRPAAPMTSATREVASHSDAPVVVVTGSTRGIGRVIARRFLGEGMRVVFHGRNALSDPEVERSVADGRALCVLADLADAEGRVMLFARVLERFARVDVLINNAGLQAFGPLAGHSAHDFQRMLEVNAIAPSDCMRRAFDAMAKRGGGCIVNIASIRSARPGANASLYAASKAALVAMTRAAAAEFGPHGIRVNAVLPGLVWREHLHAE